MIKIFAGIYKGRNIQIPIENTKPTKGSVREAVFSSIQNKLGSAVVLDVFGGSGAYSIEAISRGASKAIINDLGKEQYKIILSNISNLNIQNAKVYNLDYNDLLEKIKNNEEKFDIIFIDPPYALDCYNEIIEKLIDYSLINNDSVIILESNKELDLKKFEDFYNIKIKKYGYTIITILRGKNI